MRKIPIKSINHKGNPRLTSNFDVINLVDLAKISLQ